MEYFTYVAVMYLFFVTVNEDAHRKDLANIKEDFDSKIAAMENRINAANKEIAELKAKNSSELTPVQ